MQNIDAGALVGLVRRKGRAGYMGCRRPWPLQKLGAKAALRRRGSSATYVQTQPDATIPKSKRKASDSRRCLTKFSSDKARS